MGGVFLWLAQDLHSLRVAAIVVGWYSELVAGGRAVVRYGSPDLPETEKHCTLDKYEKHCFAPRHDWVARKSGKPDDKSGKLDGAAC